MTEAERILSSDLYHAQSNLSICEDLNAELKAENERLQQLIKEKDEQLDYLHLKLGFSENTNKKFSEAYNEKENELKSAQELNRELVEAIRGLMNYENETGFNRLQELINKAK